MANLLARNVGTVDRGVRVILGVGLLAMAVTGPHTPWGYFGVVPLVTAFLGTCPLYTLLGFSTCPVKPRTGH